VIESGGLRRGVVEVRDARVAEALRAIEPAIRKVSGIRFALGSMSAMFAASISASPAAISASSRASCLTERFRRRTGIANIPKSPLFFFSGVQLFVLGFLGEYISAIHFQVRKRPLVIERERVNFPAE